jgi:hypothetical protein
MMLAEKTAICAFNSFNIFADSFSAPWALHCSHFQIRAVNPGRFINITTVAMAAKNSAALIMQHLSFIEHCQAVITEVVFYFVIFNAVIHVSAASIDKITSIADIRPGQSLIVAM